MQDSVQKKIFAIFILVVCGFVLYWVFQFAFPSSDNFAHTPDSTVTRTATSSSLFGESSLGYLDVPLVNASSMPNLTNSVVVDASNDIVSSLKISSSTNSADILEALKNATTSPLSEALVEKYMSPDQIGLVTSVSDADISLVKDSPSALSTYAIGYRDTLLSISDIDVSKISTSLNSFMNTKETGDLDSIIQKYENIYSALRKLAVPQSRADFHKNNLIYFGSMISVLKSIRLYDADPVRAYIAAQYFPQVVAQWEPISREIIKYK